MFRNFRNGHVIRHSAFLRLQIPKDVSCCDLLRGSSIGDRDITDRTNFDGDFRDVRKDVSRVESKVMSSTLRTRINVEIVGLHSPKFQSRNSVVICHHSICTSEENNVYNL